VASPSEPGLENVAPGPEAWPILLIDATELPEWKLILLTAMTVTIVLSAHWHSSVAARAEVRARYFPSRWRRFLSYVLRHQFHYARQVPLLILFVIASVVVVVWL
jgi:hypothetical protein